MTIRLMCVRHTVAGYEGAWLEARIASSAARISCSRFSSIPYRSFRMRPTTQFIEVLIVA